MKKLDRANTIKNIKTNQTVNSPKYSDEDFENKTDAEIIKIAKSFNAQEVWENPHPEKPDHY